MWGTWLEYVGDMAAFGDTFKKSISILYRRVHKKKVSVLVLGPKKVVSGQP